MPKGRIGSMHQGTGGAGVTVTGTEDWMLNEIADPAKNPQFDLGKYWGEVIVAAPLVNEDWSKYPGLEQGILLPYWNEDFDPAIITAIDAGNPSWVEFDLDSWMTTNFQNPPRPQNPLPANALGKAVKIAASPLTGSDG